jgi:hypothetical protein
MFVSPTGNQHQQDHDQKNVNPDNRPLVAVIELVHLLNSRESAAEPSPSVHPPAAHVVRAGIALERE